MASTISSTGITAAVTEAASAGEGGEPADAEALDAMYPIPNHLYPLILTLNELGSNAFEYAGDYEEEEGMAGVFGVEKGPTVAGAAAVPPEPPRPPPPHRRVRHWYIPGVEESPNAPVQQPIADSKGKKPSTLQQTPSSSSPSSAAAASTTSQPIPQTSTSTTPPPPPQTAESCSTSSTASVEGASASEAVKDEADGLKARGETHRPVPVPPIAATAAVAEALPLDKQLVPAGSRLPAQPSSPSATAPAFVPPGSEPTKAAQKVSETATILTPTDSKGSPVKVPEVATKLSKSAEEEHEEEAQGRVAKDAFPTALRRGQEERTKRLKKLLMAALGSDFAKAGMHTDGVRTSYSMVNYQTLKRLTGLKRIPSKMLLSFVMAPDESFDWIDLSAHPTATLAEYREALFEVLRGLGVPEPIIDDSAEPLLLPQVSVLRGYHCLLLRYAIEVQPQKQLDSFQDLTNRFTIIICKNRMITVHRTQCTFTEELKVNWQSILSAGEAAATTAVGGGGDKTSSGNRNLRHLLYYMTRETIATFSTAISKSIVEFDKYEAGLFTTTRNRSSLAREIYHIKRRASVYGRALTLTQDAYSHMASSLNMFPTDVQFQEIQHDLAHVGSLADDLNANADSVLQLLFQLSSYQVNELMRVLTLFSAFFIPLSFIASAYGMNFDNIPLLHTNHGEWYCAGLMCTVAGVIFMWFKAKHFI